MVATAEQDEGAQGGMETGCEQPQYSGCEVSTAMQAYHANPHWAFATSCGMKRTFSQQGNPNVIYCHCYHLGFDPAVWSVSALSQPMCLELVEHGGTEGAGGVEGCGGVENHL